MFVFLMQRPPYTVFSSTWQLHVVIIHPPYSTNVKTSIFFNWTLSACQGERLRFLQNPIRSSFAMNANVVRGTDTFFFSMLESCLLLTCDFAKLICNRHGTDGYGLPRRRNRKRERAEREGEKKESVKGVCVQERMWVKGGDG